MRHPSLTTLDIVAAVLVGARVLAFGLAGHYTSSVLRGHHADVVVLAAWLLVILLLERVVTPVFYRWVAALDDLCPGCSAPDSEPCRAWCK